MKKSKPIALIILFGMMLLFQNTRAEAVEHSEENSKCFFCHASPTYSYYNDVTERDVTKRMNPYYLVDSILYYDQNHKSFECIDCHSYDYKTFPHDNLLRMDPLPACLDCHEGDDAVAQYNFEKIDKEYQESVHSTKHSDEFTCWMCHNPHSYKINARNNVNVKETIVYDNNICLSCHADVDKYQLITSKENPNIIEMHDWLPNQVAHFASVRCIECHAHTSEDVMVAHQIQPTEKAVKKCVECHSKNSLLMNSLYKYELQETRKSYGFSNAAILDNSYIIGANRNYYLNVLSGVFFAFILLIIMIHATLRIILK